MTMKNWYGLLGGRRNIFHQDINTIIAELAMMVKPTLVILDGTEVMVLSGWGELVSVYDVESGKLIQETDVDLDSGSEQVVVRRHKGSVELNLINPIATSLAAHLDATETLDEAAQALASELGDKPNFNFTTALQQLTSSGLLSGFALN